MPNFSLAPSRAKSVAIATLVSFLLVSTAARAAEHYYRDSVDTVTAPPARFTVEVPKSAASVGRIFIVDTDRSGLVVSVTLQQDGVRQSKSVYEYSSGARWPDGETGYDKDGVATGRSSIQRDAQGRPVNLESHTAQGDLTSRTTVSYSSDHSNVAFFAADGSSTGTGEEYFDGTGGQVRYINHVPRGLRTVDTTYDPHRGVVLSQKAFENGALKIDQRYTYDASDDVVRIDLYDEKSQWYGDGIFTQNLMTEKHYKYPSGGTKDITLAYDEHRWLTSGRESVNGTLVCTFQYDRLPDGTLKRTMVLGLDGTLLEEFPNASVTEINQDGSAPGDLSRTVYKQGNFW